VLAGARLRPSDPGLARVLHAEVRARLAAAEHRPREVLRQARKGVDLVSSWQDQFSGLEERSALAVHTRRLLTLGIEGAIALGDPELVLGWAELSRGVVAREIDVRPTSARTAGSGVQAASEDVLDLPALRATLEADGATLISYIGGDLVGGAV